jgi:hypothetical protein
MMLYSMSIDGKPFLYKGTSYLKYWNGRVRAVILRLPATSIIRNSAIVIAFRMSFLGNSGRNLPPRIYEGEMEKQRILITVKTYPTLSRKYGETVCTAGVRENGTWVRIYPVPFRRLGENEQYSKFDWIECRLIRNTSDPRPESFRPFDVKELCPVGCIGTSDNWSARRRILPNTARVYDRMDKIVESAKLPIKCKSQIPEGGWHSAFTHIL